MCIIRYCHAPNANKLRTPEKLSKAFHALFGMTIRFSFAGFFERFPVRPRGLLDNRKCHLQPPFDFDFSVLPLFSTCYSQDNH